MIVLATFALICGLVTARFYFRNIALFDKSLPVDASAPSPAVSLLIPARNEAEGIGETLSLALASSDVELEVLVLDDSSTDATADIVRELAGGDRRLRLIEGQPLPEGWCGKQHACQQLADQASHRDLVFLDADVHLDPSAISRAVAMRRRLELPLLSGFPLQVTQSFGESLLLPLINYILLCYLPFWLMRGSTSVSASAGCGQFFIADAEAYRDAGGHAEIRGSLHDGVTLPRSFRRHGFVTDVFDASDIATVRMYCGLRETWNGLMKNAHEGVANARLIVPVTAMLLATHVLPALLLVRALFVSTSWTVIAISCLALIVSLIPRASVAAKFDRQWLGVLLHPISISVFLVIQWIAFLKKLVGIESSWRGRSYAAVERMAS